MNRTGRIEELLAALFRYGSWLASATISLGFGLALIDSRFGTRNLAVLPNMRIARVGIVLFILLPALSVLPFRPDHLWRGECWLLLSDGVPSVCCADAGLLIVSKSDANSEGHGGWE